MRLDQKYKTLLSNYGINTPLRIAHFMAQIDHESGGFKWLTELGSKSYFDKYEGRKDLGNINSGDGFKYRGRGFIQITGRYNYIRLSKDTRIDFVNNPDLLSEEANAMISACWYWKLKNLNKYADLDDFKKITKLINGGYNGLQERKDLLDKWKKII